MKPPRKRRNETRRFLPGFLPFLICLWGCNPWGGTLPEHVLARVNREEITIAEFDRELKDVVLEPGKEATAADPGDLKKAYLDQMIERKILAQEARRLGIKVSSDELNRALAEIKKDYPDKGFDEWLGLKGMTLEEWKSRLEEKLLAEKMVRSTLQYPGEIREEEALRYYETHRYSFRLGPRVRVRQIVVADGEEAIQILKRLKKGESFEKLAGEKSLGPEKAKGGDLGYFSAGEMPAEFDQVFTMEVGAISGVIKSPYGYHIFKVEDKQGAREVPYGEARQGIVQELRKNKEEEEYQKWLKELKRKADVKVNSRWVRS